MSASAARSPFNSPVNKTHHPDLVSPSNVHDVHDRHPLRFTSTYCQVSVARSRCIGIALMSILIGAGASSEATFA